MRRLGSIAALAIFLSGLPAEAQPSYRNLDAGHPTRVEDATVTERYALDLDVLNLRYDELSNLRTRLLYEPRLSYGVLPRTEAWVRLPLFYRERTIQPRGGIAGVGAGAMYQFTIESEHVPALAMATEVFKPTGPKALPASVSLRALLTRSFAPGRVHLNASIASYSMREGPSLIITCPPNPAPGTACGGGDPLPPLDGPCIVNRGALRAAFLCNAAPQLLPAETQQALPGDIQTHTHWLLGVGLDKAFPLKSTLLLADLFAEKFEGIGRKTDVTAELGVRHQWRPQAVFSAGLGRHFRGAGFSTFLNLGVTLSHALQL